MFGVFPIVQGDDSGETPPDLNASANLNYIRDNAGTLSGDIQIFIVRKSGIPYDNDPSFMVRGSIITDNQSAVAFAQDTSGWIEIVVAHEVGHIFGLSKHTKSTDHHDSGPAPDGIKPLMKSGAPVGGVLPGPHDEWMRQEDWSDAND